MNRNVTVTILAMLVMGAASMAYAGPTTESPTTKREAAAQWSEDGLQQIKVSGMDLVYVRPGANMSVYNKVLIKPVSVAFRRDWERQSGTYHGTRARPEDVQRIKDDLSRAVRDEVVSELTKGGYQLVDTPGDDVLEVDVRVAELYLNAPDLPNADAIWTYTMSFGEMTLVAELRDSTTGDAVMRILDRTVGRDFGVLRFTTHADNTMEVRHAANAWARALRHELDLTKGIGR